MDAPLPSPSLQKPQHQHSYGTRSQTSSSSSLSSSSNTTTTSSYFAPTSAPTAQPTMTVASQQQLGGGQAATSPFLRDFNLVAEAAKRAQMACLMRDMEAVGLS